jgi:Crinkler effector protein N-terminal domain
MVWASKLNHVCQHLHFGRSPDFSGEGLSWASWLGENLRNLAGENPLLPLDKLSKVFSNVDETDLHIVVGRPPGALKWHYLAVALPDLLPVSHPNVTSDPPLLKINCVVLGESRSHIFTIEIANTKNVSALKKAIKAEKQVAFQHVDADTLVLWKVSFPVDESLDGNLTNLLDEESLSPVHGLLKVFSNLPKEEYLHIVVKGPSIEAIEPVEADDKLVAMVNSVYHIF